MVENNIFIRMEYELISACRNGNFENAKLLIENGVDINALDGMPLLKAIESCNYFLIKYLINNGANINVRNGVALLKSIETESREITKLLLEHGINISTDSFILACKKGYSDLIELFLKGKCDVNKGFLKACKYGHIDVIRLLLDHGADINVKRGQALIIAVENDKSDVVQLLFEKGIILREYNLVAFVDAAGNGLYDITKIIIKNNPQKYRFNEAFNEALESNHVDIIRLFLENGYEYKPVKDDPHMIKTVQNGNYEIAKILMCFGIKYKFEIRHKIEIYEYFGCAMRIAIKNNDNNIIKIFLDDKYRNYFIDWFMVIAVQYEKWDMLLLPFSNSKNIRCDNGLINIYEIMIRKNKMDLLKKIISSASENSIKKFMTTNLHILTNYKCIIEITHFIFSNNLIELIKKENIIESQDDDFQLAILILNCLKENDVINLLEKYYYEIMISRKLIMEVCENERFIVLKYLLKHDNNMSIHGIKILNYAFSVALKNKNLALYKVIVEDIKDFPHLVKTFIKHSCSLSSEELIISIIKTGIDLNNVASNDIEHMLKFIADSYYFPILKNKLENKYMKDISNMLNQKINY